MILTGKEIMKRLGSDIIIEPFQKESLNPNSYNLRLSDKLMVYTDEVLDPKKQNSTEIINIPEEGIVLEPGRLYLASTIEYTETFNLVPMIIGRSSLGRLGVGVHITSGFGDVGFCGCWTLQLTCMQKVQIYSGMKICQIFYHTICGESENYNSAKYQDSRSIMASEIYKEMK